METYATGLTVIVAVLVAWVGVQIGWRRVFPEASSDPDALAGRMGCHGCAGEHSRSCSETAACDERSRCDRKRGLPFSEGS